VPSAPAILPGLTARWLEEIAAACSIELTHEPISLGRLLGADEVFVTATTQLAMPVVAIDDRPIGTGRAGPVASTLAAAMRAELDL
jgi:branched-subunit amino acid aminotransferase/4-amino-4-deoxychorismate lyase